MAIETKEVKLSGDRTATVRELTGADEMLALQLCTKDVNMKSEKDLSSAVMSQQSVMVVLSILKVDDEPQSPPQSLKAAIEFMAGFKLRDWNKLREAYAALNNSEDFLEEPTNSVEKVSGSK